MKTLTGKEFCRIRQSRGWQLRRIKGSHRIYTRGGICLALPFAQAAKWEAVLPANFFNLSRADSLDQLSVTAAQCDRLIMPRVSGAGYH